MRVSIAEPLRDVFRAQQRSEREQIVLRTNFWTGLISTFSNQLESHESRYSISSLEVRESQLIWQDKEPFDHNKHRDLDHTETQLTYPLFDWSSVTFDVKYNRHDLKRNRRYGTYITPRNFCYNGYKKGDFQTGGSKSYRMNATKMWNQFTKTLTESDSNLLDAIEATEKVFFDEIQLPKMFGRRLKPAEGLKI